MAARAPTTFTKFVDESKLLARKDILFTEVDEIMDDQHLIYLKDEMILGDMFPTIISSSASPTWEVLRTFHVMGRQNDVGGSEQTYQWSVLAWGAGSVTSFEVGVEETVNRPGTINTIAIAALVTNKNWRAWTNVSMHTDGTTNNVDLMVRRTGGTGNMFVAGFCMFTGT